MDMAKNLKTSKVTTVAAASAQPDTHNYLYSYLLIFIVYVCIVYNGFKTATNLKKWQHIALYLLSPVLTFHQFYSIPRSVT
jgi:hypothetical protein